MVRTKGRLYLRLKLAYCAVVRLRVLCCVSLCLLKGRIVVFDQCYGKGDYCLLFGMIKAASACYSKRLVILCAKNRNDVISCYPISKRVTCKTIPYGYGQHANEQILDLMYRLASKHPASIRLITMDIFQKGKEANEYISVDKLRWKYGLQLDLCNFHSSLPTVPAGKAEKAKSYLRQFEDGYILFNVSTPSTRLQGQTKLFSCFLEASRKYLCNRKVGILMNSVEQPLRCDFQELYWLVWYSIGFISIRSGIHDFTLGIDVPTLIVQSTHDYVSKCFDVRKFDYHSKNIFVIEWEGDVTEGAVWEPLSSFLIQLQSRNKNRNAKLLGFSEPFLLDTPANDG